MATTIDAEFFVANGYVLIKGLFPPDECEELREHFMELRKKETPMDDAGLDIGQANDPLKQFPRIIHPHRWDKRTFDWMLDARIEQVLATLLGEAPLAGQTMFYFKPAGARGQALHQDQKYLRVSPGTCVAAWLALDNCDEENGCLQVVPGTHDLPLICTTEADTTQSFTNDYTPLPSEMKPMNVEMEAGDVLFFNGSIVHGSGPNTSKGRFRRSLIGHYLSAEAEQVSEFYTPAYRFDGTVAEIATTNGGGQCGVWVEKDGRSVIEFMEDGQAVLVGPH